MNAVKLCTVAVVVCCLSAASASAQTNTWTATFPKSPAAGMVQVDGTATAQAGWMLTGTGLVAYWKDGPNGGVVKSVPIMVDPMTGKWNLMFPSDFGAGVKIVIVVQASQTMGANQNVIATPPGTVTP